MRGSCLLRGSLQDIHPHQVGWAEAWAVKAMVPTPNPPPEESQLVQDIAVCLYPAIKRLSLQAPTQA